MGNAIVVSNPIVAKMAARFGVNADEVMETLKATCFKGPATDSQMMALLIVADQYSLNPWTREIYAFPDKNNGIVPVVGVDGWSRIINGHPQFDGMEFVQDAESCTCVMYRKDRGHPVRVTEYLSECKRPVQPWQTHPKRMLRHKAMIQCARLAFGYVGIYDQDEAERIIDMGEAQEIKKTPAQIGAAAMPVVSDAADRTEELKTIIADLEETAKEDGLPGLERHWKNVLTKQQRTLVGAVEWARIKALATKPEPVGEAESEFVAEMDAAAAS